MGKQKPEVTHADLIDRPLAVGDIVAARVPGALELKLATVIKLTKKQVKIEFADSHHWRSANGRREGYVDPRDTVKLDGPDLAMYLLKNSS
jgi:hypothetical protein